MTSEICKVLVLTTSFPSPTNPGSGIFVSRLLGRLPRTFRLTVLTPGVDSAKRLSGWRNIQVAPFRYAPIRRQTLFHGPGGLPAALKGRQVNLLFLPVLCGAAFLAVCRFGRRADLIHAQWGPAGCIAGLAGRWIGVPVITTLRGTDIKWARQSRFFRLVLRGAVSFSAAVVCVSHAISDRMSSWFPASVQKFCVIPNGVDVRGGPSVRPEAGGHPMIAVIGNLIPGKQADVVVRAFRGVVSVFPEARLVVVGDGPEKEKLMRLSASLEIENAVTFYGRVGPEKVGDILRRSAALVLASESEGRPNVVLEAMAAGTPVVATDINGVREIITHGKEGLLFPVGDVNRLSGHLLALLRRPELGRGLADQARRFLVERKLTWEHAAAAHGALYEQVIASYRRWNQRCAE